VRLAGVDLGAYRLFLVAVVSLIALALIASLRMTKAGARIRASVDDAQAAAGLGIDVGRVFALTFTLGSALSALGGALSIDVFGLDPTFPLKYLVYFLLVVVVGGSGSIAGSLLASMVLGVLDVAGKYYVPQIGAFVIYGLMIALLLLSPGGLRRMAR
jgi:branched-chain amino acid transport system permease protein